MCVKLFAKDDVPIKISMECETKKHQQIHQMRPIHQELCTVWHGYAPTLQHDQHYISGYMWICLAVEGSLVMLSSSEVRSHWVPKDMAQKRAQGSQGSNCHQCNRFQHLEPPQKIQGIQTHVFSISHTYINSIVIICYCIIIVINY